MCLIDVTHLKEINRWEGYLHVVQNFEVVQERKM